MDEYKVQHEGWAPFGEGRKDMFTNPVLTEIARAHGKSVGQVIRRWNVQRDVIVIRKSVRKERILENISVFDFELTDKEMGRIAMLDERVSLFFLHDDPEMGKKAQQPPDT